MRGGGQKQGTIRTLLTLLLVVLVLANSFLYFTRIDLTEEKVFSISKVSRNLFLEIDDQVHIAYYLSNTLKSRAAEIQQIADILYQYAAFSRGKISVNVIDPAESGIAEDVEAAGVLPRQIQVIEENQQSIAVVYSGIVLSYLDRSETIPFIIETASLEYELSSAIRKLVRDEQQVLGILVGDDRKSLQQNYPFVNNQLRQLLELQEFFPGEEISRDISAVAVLGASALNATDMYEIDQYLMSGGNVFLAVDGVNVNIDISFLANQVGALPVFDVLQKYGIVITQELIADAYNLRIPVQRQTGGNLVVQQLLNYPYWITLLGGSADTEHPITARFAGLDIYWASPITLVNADDARITPLLHTSPESWLISEPPFYTEPQQAFAITGSADTSENAMHTVGVIIAGTINSGFSETPAAIQEERGGYQHIATTDQGKIIVISDTDFIGVLNQYTQSFHNYTFFQDAVSWLVNDDDLITIRTRANRDIRLNALDEEQTISVGRAAALFNIFIIPFAIALFGIIRFLIRRKQETLPVARTEQNAGAHKKAKNSKEQETPHAE